MAPVAGQRSEYPDDRQRAERGQGHAALLPAIGGRVVWNCRVKAGDAQVLASQRVLNQAGDHAHACQSETQSPAHLLTHPAAGERGDERTEVDAHIEDEKAASRRPSPGA